LILFISFTTSLSFFLFSEPLKFVEKPQSQQLKKDDNTVTFKCLVTGSTPIAIEWFKGGQLLKSNQRMKITDVSLDIRDVVSADEGFYQCFARNEYESIQSNAQLVVTCMFLCFL